MDVFEIGIDFWASRAILNEDLDITLLDDFCVVARFLAWSKLEDDAP